MQNEQNLSIIFRFKLWWGTKKLVAAALTGQDLASMSEKNFQDVYGDPSVGFYVFQKTQKLPREKFPVSKWTEKPLGEDQTVRLLEFENSDRTKNDVPSFLIDHSGMVESMREWVKQSANKNM